MKVRRSRYIDRNGIVGADALEVALTVSIEVDGEPVEVLDEQQSLMTVLRNQCGKTSVKDGCAPQGQCGCCTVLVDGQPRVSCVTPVRRVADRSITTLDGLPEDERAAWAKAFVATGGSQCGFCTPGIICRLSGLRAAGVDGGDAKLGNGLAAHLCRCTGWQTITEAYVAFGQERELGLDAAAERATLEGGSGQRVGLDVALGDGGFAVDSIPSDALFAVPSGESWVVGASLEDARTASGKIQGRRTTAKAKCPIEIPDGDWAVTLQTSWVEPAHLETETSWCVPGGDPSTVLANGGAFGAKQDTTIGEVAKRLAEEHGRPVAAVLSREDSVQLGAKRPPMAAGIRADGTGEILVARTAGITEMIGAVAPGLTVTELDLLGPPTSSSLRGAGWVEAAVLVGALNESNAIIAPSGGRAEAIVDDNGIHVSVSAGMPLDPIVLRSYCIGAAHMAYSWVTSEQLAVDTDGVVHDLTIRSFGIVRASDMPPVHVTINESTDKPVNGSDAVFASVALAMWRSLGLPSAWPTR